MVEPNYKNKYPPIGLMKIATYFKLKGDFVEFQKGLLPQKVVSDFEKVFITTLFTFDFDVCIETIRYYVEIVGINNVYVGGIASTIMPERFEGAIPGINILKGQLTSSNILGYDDNVNIDILPLDYDILWDIPYDYPAADSYFVYTSRGCPRKCSFCAVKTLEPVYYECENIKEQILNVDEHFGIKKQLLIMDNNALNSVNLERNVITLVNLGFGAKNNTIKKNNKMRFYIQSLIKRQEINKQYLYLLERIKKEINSINVGRISNIDKNKLQPLFALISSDDNEGFVKYLIEHQEYITDFFERYNYHKIKRYVDFNQGLDARLFTPEKAQLLAKLAIKPCRIAFDDINTKVAYFNAITMASKAGIEHFSNYLLYNFKEKPQDLWKRLYLNVKYCEKNKNIKTFFSFPMKYASIEHTDRSYIGKYWNAKYLKSINIILNVTSGVVPKEKDFFLRAYGESEEEFESILTMPSDFIRYREYFDNNGLINKWKTEYEKLSDTERIELLNILSNCKNEQAVLEKYHSPSLNEILPFYLVKKNKMEKNKSYYYRMFGLN